MYKYIQGCRAIAALFVVVFHLSGALAAEKYLGSSAGFLQKLFIFGDCGVPFFFVLSGFIITLIHRKDFGAPACLFKYMQKRAVRIYPSFLIIFTVVYLVALAFPSTRNTVPHDASTLTKALLLLPQDGAPPVITVAWTLQYEMLFYTAIGVAIINRYLMILLVLAFLANFTVAKIHGVHDFPESFFTQNLIFLFFIGMFAAYIAKSKLMIKRPIVLCSFAGFAFLCLAVMEVLFGKDTPFLDHRLAYGVISGILIVGLVRTEDRQLVAGKMDLGRAGFITLMGDASYALYLLHFPLISILCKLTVKVGLHGSYGALIAFVIILSTCILAALAFYSYVERPILSKFSGTLRRSIANKARLAV